MSKNNKQISKEKDYFFQCKNCEIKQANFICKSCRNYYCKDCLKTHKNCNKELNKIEEKNKKKFNLVPGQVNFNEINKRYNYNASEPSVVDKHYSTSPTDTDIIIEQKKIKKITDSYDKKLDIIKESQKKTYEEKEKLIEKIESEHNKKLNNFYINESKKKKELIKTDEEQNKLKLNLNAKEEDKIKTLYNKKFKIINKKEEELIRKINELKQENKNLKEKNKNLEKEKKKLNDDLERLKKEKQELEIWKNNEIEKIKSQPEFKNEKKELNISLVFEKFDDYKKQIENLKKKLRI